MCGVKSIALILVTSMALITFSFGVPVVYDASALSYDILRLSSPSLRNVAGEKIDAVDAGQQAVITISMHNNLEHEQAFVVLVEIRDSTGITHQLSWQSSTIAANGDYAMDVSWKPEHICWEQLDPDSCHDNYEIRAFAITSLKSPQVLSSVSLTDGIRVIGFPPNPPLDQHQFGLTLDDGRKYTIDYSFSRGGGKIAEIKVVDNGTKSVEFVLSGVSENSRFTVTMPTFLYNHLLVNNAENKTVQIEAFVDGTKITSFSSLGDNNIRKSTFVFSLGQGTEEVKIVGTPVA